MLVKIRFGAGRKASHRNRKKQRFALEVAALMTPAALMALVLALWRLAADLKLTGEFPIASGVLSHWQIWLAAAALIQLGAIALIRYGKAEAVFRKTVDTADQKFVNTRF
jgi:hypothetical protein